MEESHGGFQLSGPQILNGDGIRSGDDEEATEKEGADVIQPVPSGG